MAVVCFGQAKCNKLPVLVEAISFFPCHSVFTESLFASPGLSPPCFVYHGISDLRARPFPLSGSLLFLLRMSCGFGGKG